MKATTPFPPAPAPAPAPSRSDSTPVPPPIPRWSDRFAPRTRNYRRSAIRELLKLASRPDMISFAGGLPAPELLPVEEVQAATEAVLRRVGSRALQYSETEGHPELRDWIASYLSRPESGLQLDRHQVVVTTGAQQALDLLGRILFHEGDHVVVENPTYLAALSAWRPFGARFRGIPADERGLRVDALAAPLRDRPKALYAIPNFQNPRGTTLSAERRRELVRLGRHHDVAIIEDDPYGELRDDPVALPSLLECDALAAGDPANGNVIHCGSFSKILAPGLRVGWVAAPAIVAERLIQAKQSADLHTGTLDQLVALELVRNGTLDTRLPLLRSEYRRRREAMLTALARHFPAGTTWTRPTGGLFLWVTLPDALDAARLLQEALDLGVAYVPGETFHLEDGGRNTLRLNFSHPSADRIEEGIRRLASVIGDSRA